MFTSSPWRRSVIAGLCLTLLLGARALAEPVDPEALAPPSRIEEPAPPVDGVELVDLQEVLRRALADSPTLERQLAVLRERDYRIEEAYTRANPTVDFQAQYQRVEPPVTFSTGTVITPADNYSFALTLRQPIYTFGRLKFSVLAAKLEERSAEEEYVNLLQDVILGGIQLYIDALVAEEGVKIATDELDAQLANLRVARLLFEQGVSARFDVLRTGAEASRAQQALLEANTQQELARDRLKSFMDMPAEQPVQLQPMDLQAPPAVDLRQKKLEVLEQRADLRALRWATEAAKARVSLARAEGAPTLSLQNQTINRNATGFTPGTQNTTAVVFSFPLFDGGVSRARAQQAEEVVHQLEADVEQRERDVVLETEEAFRRLQDRWSSIRVAEENVEQAEEALRISLLRYQNGISTTVELLDTQAARTRAASDLARARADYQSAYWSWRRITGEDYPVEVPLPQDVRERRRLEADGRP